MSPNIINKREIYHEKQVRELCALHSLNNLLQDPSAFTKNDLDKICQRLSPDHWVNPHRSLLGTGNYDINVIMAALQTKGCSVMWFDKRKDPSSIAVELVLGFILNMSSEMKVGPVKLPFRNKHWFAVKKVKGSFYNLDSKLENPFCIGQKQDLVSWLRDELCCKDKELFIVSPDKSSVVSSLQNGDSESNHLYSDDYNLTVNIPSTTENQQQHNILSMLDKTSNVDGMLDKDLQNKLLASAEGEEAFSSPGLKFIEDDAQSVENSLDCNIGNNESKVDCKER